MGMNIPLFLVHLAIFWYLFNASNFDIQFQVSWIQFNYRPCFRGRSGAN